VADPITGLHDWVGAIDLNSLYPTCIRAINMSPETLFAQLVPTYTRQYIDSRFRETKSATDAWHNVFGSLEYQMVMKETEDPIEVAFEGGDTVTMKACDVYEMIFDPSNSLCISGNGTIYRTDIEGIIPGLLTRWFSERKAMQGKKKNFTAMLSGVSIDDDLAKLLAE
jgi:DNA polymerase elongation subunit (family B)